MHRLCFYDDVPDFVERRGELRPLHFEHAHADRDRGELLMSRGVSPIRPTAPCWRSGARTAGS